MKCILGLQGTYDVPLCFCDYNPLGIKDHNQEDMQSSSPKPENPHRTPNETLRTCLWAGKGSSRYINYATLAGAILGGPGGLSK